MASQLLNLFDYEHAAKARMSSNDYDFVAGGVADEISLHRNHAAFESIMIRPRMLCGVETPDLRTTVLGSPVQHPIMVAPMGGQGAIAAEAERATAKASGQGGALFVLSSGSTLPCPAATVRRKLAVTHVNASRPRLPG